MEQKIVITHIKADFDAISSAWAACRLYNCDAIWVCTDFEQNVRSFIKSINNSHIVFVKPSDIEAVESIEHLIITDCKHKKRLGALAPLIDKAKKISIFDHHPAYAKDIDANEEVIEELGATVTILVKRLLAAGCEISPLDATMYMLGIYEDTGMLTFSSTTPDDAAAVAKLLEAGGDSTVISDYVKREYSREQVFILNELLMNMTVMNVDGVNVTYAFASIDVYIDELAFLAHRMMEMEGLESLFILVRTGSRIVLIGRSKDPHVDASHIVQRFGGGGHSAAASANIKDLELHEAVELLKVTLREHIKPVRIVEEIMTAPARYLKTGDNIEYAWDFTLKFNLNQIPVVDENMKTVGILSRRDILQGVKHGLTKEAVSLLMNTEIETVTPDTPFRIAEDILISTSQKLLPVEKNKKLAGVVSRTDLLRLMHEESVQRSAYEEGAKTRLGLSRTRCVTDTMKAELPPEIYKCLKEIGAIAAENTFPAYIVGGFVRDLLMSRPNTDLDIVVEGNAIAVAQAYARLKSAKLTIHEKYKTASVTLASGEKIDFATSRTEYYSTPGAAPAVEFSSLRSDLSRRDFTINAMAVRIDSEDFGQLIDYFGGQRDILDKKIRVLHSLSFIDDPTRAFRAIRFAARYAFELGGHTERLLKHAESLGLFTKIRGGKLFIEIKYILSESRYLKALEMLARYGMLGFIVPGLGVNNDREEQFSYLEKLWAYLKDKLAPGTQIWMARYALLMYNYSAGDYKKVIEELRVEETMGDKLIKIHAKSKFAARKIKGMKTPRPSEIYKIFKKMNGEELLMTGLALGEELNYLLITYIDKDRYTKPELTGYDLKKMGVPESKEMGKILTELLYAKLDGKVSTREQEEEYVRKHNIQ